MMKRNLKKVVAAAMAMTMCVPTYAFAADASGTFDTSFDIYSPVLTISVPVKLDVEVNPMADNTATDVKKFTVASNSIDIINSSVDVEKDIAIPVNVTVKASISKKNDGVITEYNTFTADNTSTKKRINLNLTAGTGTSIKVKDGGTAAFDTDKRMDLSQFVVDTASTYAAGGTPITKYGSLLSLDIAGPSTTDSTAGATFSTDATKIKPAVGSFAVTGVANTNADWKADDIKVDVAYNVKASNALSITTPTITTAPTFNAASATDVEIAIPGVGEATVIAMAVHNDGEGLYGDFLFENDTYTVEYTTSAGSTTATITIPQDNGTLSFLTGDEYSGKAQDLIIALSDGRYVVSTLTCTAAPASSTP